MLDWLCVCSMLVQCVLTNIAKVFERGESSFFFLSDSVCLCCCCCRLLLSTTIATSFANVCWNVFLFLLPSFGLFRFLSFSHSASTQPHPNSLAFVGGRQNETEFVCPFRLAMNTHWTNIEHTHTANQAFSHQIESSSNDDDDDENEGGGRLTTDWLCVAI